MLTTTVVSPIVFNPLSYTIVARFGQLALYLFEASMRGMTRKEQGNGAGVPSTGVLAPVPPGPRPLSPWYRRFNLKVMFNAQVMGTTQACLGLSRVLSSRQSTHGFGWPGCRARLNFENRWNFGIYERIMTSVVLVRSLFGGGFPYRRCN